MGEKEELLERLAVIEKRAEHVKLSKEQQQAKETDEILLKQFWSSRTKEQLNKYKMWVCEEKGRNSIMWAKLNGIQLNYFEGGLFPVKSHKKVGKAD